MTEAAPPRLSGNGRGALWMVASGVGFTIYLVFAKLLSETSHPVFLAFVRALIGLILTLPVLYRAGLGVLRTPRFGLVAWRSLFGSLGFILSLIAVSDFFQLPLSQFNAISFSRPLFVTILAAFILGELVGPRRWAAIAIGFAGVLIMTAPGLLPGAGEAATVDLGSVLALASAVAFAGAIILVKTLSRDHSPSALLIWANLLSTVLLLPAAIIFWSSPTWGEWGQILAMSVAGLGAQFCYITAMSIGDASVLSSMDYLRLPMAALADWLLFRLLPGLHVWLGAGIIVAAALYIALRERTVAAQNPRSPDTRL